MYCCAFLNYFLGRGHLIKFLQRSCAAITNKAEIDGASMILFPRILACGNTKIMFQFAVIILFRSVPALCPSPPSLYFNPSSQGWLCWGFFFFKNLLPKRLLMWASFGILKCLRSTFRDPLPMDMPRDSLLLRFGDVQVEWT